MADETNPIQDSTEQQPAEALKTEKSIPYERFAQVNSELQSLRRQQAETEKAIREREASAMAEQGKYKELYEATLKELDPLRRANEDAKRYRERLEADNQARIERIPETKRSLIPEYDDPVKLGAWLTANEAEFSTPQKPLAPNLGGGAGGANPLPPFKLTDEELSFARMAGISAEQYAAAKAEKGQPIQLGK